MDRLVCIVLRCHLSACAWSIIASIKIALSSKRTWEQLQCKYKADNLLCHSISVDVAICLNGKLFLDIFSLVIECYDNARWVFFLFCRAWTAIGHWTLEAGTLCHHSVDPAYPSGADFSQHCFGHGCISRVDNAHSLVNRLCLFACYLCVLCGTVA